MRLLLLANPEASAYKRVKLAAVECQLADAPDVTMARTEERGCIPCCSLAPWPE